MSTIHGLPAHVLLIHFMVVLTPLTALLAIGCALWPGLRRRLVWLTLALAVVTVILTPLTTGAGEWLIEHVGQSPPVGTHANLGETMIYFTVPLGLVAVLLAALHVRQERGHTVKPLAQWLLAVIVLVVAVAAMVQIYRVGDSGAQAAWGGLVSSGST